MAIFRTLWPFSQGVVGQILQMTPFWTSTLPALTYGTIEISHLKPFKIDIFNGSMIFA